MQFKSWNKAMFHILCKKKGNQEVSKIAADCFYIEQLLMNQLIV